MNRSMGNEFMKGSLISLLSPAQIDVIEFQCVYFIFFAPGLIHCPMSCF